MTSPDGIPAQRPLPGVSVITPVYNGADFIAETVESVLAERYPNLDYIVVDDGSTDGTAELLGIYADRGVRVITQKNAGEARAVNLGAAEARHDIVAVINADDPIKPGLIHAAAALLTERPDLVGCYPDWDCIDQTGRVIESRETLPWDYRVLVEQHACIPGPGAFFHKSALGVESPRNPAFRYSSDYELWLRLGLKGPMARIPRILATWRHHLGSATISQRNLEMAQNKIDVICSFFARPDLSAEVRSWRRQALSAAYYRAALTAEDNPAVPAKRYLIRSLMLKPLWPARVLPFNRRSLGGIAYGLLFPLSRPLRRLIVGK